MQSGSEIQNSIDLPMIRQRIGVPLAQISQVTRISVHYLQAIEEEDFEKLPGGIYDTSYIRQYAKAIGYDEHELLAHYHALMKLEPAVQVNDQNLQLAKGSKSNLIARILKAAGLSQADRKPDKLLSSSC